MELQGHNNVGRRGDETRLSTLFCFVSNKLFSSIKLVMMLEGNMKKSFLRSMVPVSICCGCDLIDDGDFNGCSLLFQPALFSPHQDSMAAVSFMDYSKSSQPHHRKT